MNQQLIFLIEICLIHVILSNTIGFEALSIPVGGNTEYQLGYGNNISVKEFNISKPIELDIMISPPKTLSSYIAAGWFNSFFFEKSSGLGYCVGLGDTGQLMNGVIGSLKDVGSTGSTFLGMSIQKLSASRNHTLIANSNKIYAVGSNIYGQCGRVFSDVYLEDYLEISGVSGNNVAAGEFHSLVVLTNGSVMAFGRNNKGQLGLGTSGSISTPTVIPGLENITEIAAGRSHSLFLSNNSELYVTGDNQFGQLGDGTFTDKNLPTLLSPIIPGITGIEAFDHTVLVTATKVYSFGLNTYGQLGNGQTKNLNTPYEISSIPRPRNISVGFGFTLVSTYKTQVYRFGSNDQGQLGLNFATNLTTPTLWPGVLGVVSITTGYEHTILAISNLTCYGIQAFDPTVCSGHGGCISTNCSCDDGYVGLDCSAFTCGGKNASDPIVCSSHGTCVGGNNCSCSSNYTGDECEFNKCFGVGENSPLVCSGNGACVGTDTCTCNSTHGGNECQTPICFGTLGTNASVCSSKGSCISPNICNCSFGYI
eukprot:gene5532-9349_t